MDKFVKLTKLHMAARDLDTLKAFYTEKLGFIVTSDFAYDQAQAAKAGVSAGNRWISIQLPGGGTSFNLTNVYENMRPGTMKLYISTPGIQAASQELKARGVKLAHDVTQDGWGTWFDFVDPDGNQWVVVESK